ncbi:MAG: hypothetical protein KDK99_20215 [Verrucomicrobiales bacterium]|nr:hypothetical protein [Verrucomicrobiales bacterium]
MQEIVSERFFGRRKRDFLTHLHATLNAPQPPVRNRLIRLIRLTADSPGLLAIIKEEGG